jgi:hypothetical protein
MDLYAPAATMIDHLDAAANDYVISWSCPIPFFGGLETARVATVGINPSNREFIDESGDELDGGKRRLPTLGSMGLASWADADALHLRKILEACMGYFLNNPYDRWFKVLEHAIGETNASFYGHRPAACHLDLVPFATSVKWGELPSDERLALLDASRNPVGLFLRHSPIEFLVLNGQTVIGAFQQLANVTLATANMPTWELPRLSGRAVPGVAYWGTVDRIADVDIGRTVMVVGYNHNLQSSYGITTSVLASIRSWVGEKWAEIR